jgi:nucleoid-associated protein YgaU
MAYINQYYLFVDDESANRSVSISEHPVEKGMVITDNVKREPLEISISGIIAGADAETTKDALYSLMKSGSYVKYIGREIISNAVIISFETSRKTELDGGMDFEMTVREIRVARSAYQGASVGNTVKSGTQQVTKNNTTVYHTVKSGDTLYSLSLMYYGSDSGYVKLYSSNKEAIEKAARNAGYTSSDGGHVLISGTQILIP